MIAGRPSGALHHSPSRTRRGFIASLGAVVGTTSLVVGSPSGRWDDADTELPLATHGVELDRFGHSVPTDDGRLTLIGR